MTGDNQTPVVQLNQWPKGWWLKRVLLLAIVFIPTFVVEFIIRPESNIIRIVFAIGCIVQVADGLRRFSKKGH